MVQLSNQEFEAIVSKAIDAIPERYFKYLNNVAFVIEDIPTPVQRDKLRLRCDQTLFGLYEGIPLTRRGAGYNLVLPDKITIFKQPIEAISQSMEELIAHVKQTVWHEVGHFYGLDHDRIHALERKPRT
jgi:predicted Zn-dependent protease with MMP-like domain